MARDKSISTPARELESYEDCGKDYLKSIKLTLGSAATVTSIVLADDVKGFRLYPASADLRFSVNEQVEVEATSSAVAIVVANLAVGGIAKADQWETRLLEASNGSGRTLYLVSATGSLVVEVETF